MKKSILMLTIALSTVSGAYAEGVSRNGARAPRSGSGSEAVPAATHICLSQKHAIALREAQANMMSQMDTLEAKLQSTVAQLAAAKVRKTMTQAQSAVNKGLNVAVGGASRRARKPRRILGGNKTAPKRKSKRSKQSRRRGMRLSGHKPNHA